MDLLLRFDIYASESARIPIAWTLASPADALMPLGWNVEGPTPTRFAIGWRVLNDITTRTPVAYRLAGEPAHLTPLAWRLASASLHGLPVAWRVKHGAPMPYEGLIVDPRLLDLLPVITPVGRSLLIQLEGEDPSAIPPLP